MDAAGGFMNAARPPLATAENIQSFLASSRWKGRFDDEVLAVASSFVSKVKELKLESGKDG